MTEVRVEPARFDSPDAVALRAEAVAETHARYDTDTEWTAHPTASDTPVFLIARAADGELIGCGALRRHEDETVELKRMYVRPAWRRRGIGVQILDALEREARALGARRVVLETGTEQPEAVSLYEGRGYVRTPCWGWRPSRRCRSASSVRCERAARAQPSRLAALSAQVTAWRYATSNVAEELACASLMLSKSPRS